MLVLGGLAFVVLLRPDGERPRSLTVFAASSLRSVTDELEAAWLAAEPETSLVIATEASNVLAAQIEEGAQADVFISADDVQPRRLADADLTAAAPVPFARNEIALVARPDGPVATAADLAAAGATIVVGGPATPIGRYTEQALWQLAQAMPDPMAFAAAVETNIASREDNVRAALAKVELGEGDAAFVYRTDAVDSEDTIEIELPPGARVAAAYVAVQVSQDEAAAAFVDWLGSAPALRILSDAGFEVVA